MNGTGVSPSLEGILATEGVQEHEFATDMFTTCRQALTKLQTVGGIVGGADVTFVVNPADFEAMELAQRGDSGYHYGGPVDAGQQKLWGKNVLVSNSVAAGTAIAGRFSDAEIVTRGPIEIA
ncbi:MAG: hypothetical protein GKR86_16100 [Ilumatobacter sp.]|nr:hypothetical protein [Ilumatobacter sp.]